MKLPFTTEQFFEVFRNYNTAVFPMQVILNGIAVMAIYFLFRKDFAASKIISGMLVFFWLWMGVIYHLLFFTTVNNAAYLFGFLFFLQSLLFLWKGVFKNELSFRFQKNFSSITGTVLMLFALFIYPLIGYFSGHIYPYNPTFGLPCPVTIFTFGLLLITDKRIPVIVLVIPFLWSIIGTFAAFLLDVREDTGLLIAAFIAAILLIMKNRRLKYEQVLKTGI